MFVCAFVQWCSAHICVAQTCVACAASGSVNRHIQTQETGSGRCNQYESRQHQCLLILRLISHRVSNSCYTPVGNVEALSRISFTNEIHNCLLLYLHMKGFVLK